jgi:GNAT superfamily N-acetyltransferase
VSLRLRDGSRVVVRPVVPTDREQLREGFEHLSRESRYQRFLSPIARLPDEWLTYLTEVDHRDHEALAALDATTGQGVGVARFVRNPGRPDAAEAAVTVADDWQGKGLGTLLLELLAARAREEGIASFTALVLAENDEMLGLLERLGPTHVIDRQRGTVEVEAQLPERGLSPQLRGLLRLARDGRSGASPPRSVPPGAPGRAPARRPPGSRPSPSRRS